MRGVTPGPGAWSSIAYEVGARGRVSGSTIQGGGGDGFGDVKLVEAGVPVTGSTLRDSAAYGIYCDGGCGGYAADTLTGNTFTGVALGDRN